jgi:phosphoribosyl 1,2-cyclic phosphodiesterase
MLLHGTDDGMYSLPNAGRPPDPRYAGGSEIVDRVSITAGAGADFGDVGLPETHPEDLGRMISGRSRLRFWGVRGTLPVPGYRSLKYGGNTSCVSLELPNGELFVFDAGSGIKELSSFLGHEKPVHGRIFLSHPHWDHINAFPFFAPLYVDGNEFEILGAAQGSISVKDLISAQMDGVYFPITIQQFCARIRFRDLDEGSFQIGGAEVSTLRLSHPGSCLGYRVRYEGRSICYVTDNELFSPGSPRHSEEYVGRLVEFVRDADALITDTTYSDEEYGPKEGWGHSCVSQVAALADRADVRTLFIFHHDPDQTDEDIDRKHEACVKALRDLGSTTECIAPKERDDFSF